MSDETVGKPQPDKSLTPSFREDDIRGRVFGQTYPRALHDGMDVIRDGIGKIYAINFRIDPLRVDMKQGENSMIKLRPRSIPTNDLTIVSEKLDYNENNRFDVVSIRFGSSLNKNEWNAKKQLAFATRVRTAWQLAGKKG